MRFPTLRPSAATVQKFYDSTDVVALGQDEPDLAACDVSRASATPFEANCSKTPTDPQQLDTRVFPIQMLSQPTVKMRQTGFIPSVHYVALLDSPNLRQLFSSEREFSHRVERLFFDVPRREPFTSASLFDTLASRQSTSLRIGKVEPVERPPGLEARDVTERIRWLLTPPVNELLSDPDLAIPERPYGFQLQGVRWLYDRPHALLADEMGLGKSMQAILAARLLWRANEIQQVLIICPKSLIGNWQAELRKWWSNITSNLLVCAAGMDRHWFLKIATTNVAVKLMNYESLTSEREWLRENRVSHDLVIIDEAQRIKNTESKTAQCVKLLRGTRCWALTGTPLENRVEDVVSIFEFVRPGTVHIGSPARIGKAICPFMLRRRTDDSNVKVDLPARKDVNFPIELGTEQRETYRRAEEDGVLELNAKGDSITITHVFQLIHRLRQLCNFDPSTGSSAKFDVFCEDFEEISESGRKAIVFSQFTSDDFGLKRIARAVEARNWRALQLHGEVPPSRREQHIAAFQNDSSYNLLLLNYQVGGVGLNLQAATYVYLFDRWWNPAVEDQAVKRAHRIGQKQTVLVKRFYCRDTIEERILLELAKKRRLFTTVIDENRPAETAGLTQEEYFSLFDLKIRAPSSPTKAVPVRFDLDAISPTQFEMLVAKIYEAQGYTVQLTAASHDGGIDVIASRESGGGRDRIAVQCKHQEDNVGRPVLQQLWGVVSSDPSFTRADVVSSAGFSREAREFASGKRMTLIERTAVIRLAREHEVADL